MTLRARSRGDAIWIALIIAINGVVLLNAVLHDPEVGYDAADHLQYIEVLSRFRLPVREETLEFFSPPLPYVAPALLAAAGVSTWGAAKGAQLLNVVVSIALTLCLVRLCDRVRPEDPRLKTAALACFGALPVTYKAFAFVRGEPLLALLALLVCERALALDLAEGWQPRRALALGGLLGGALLARQWGFFLIPAVAIFVAARAIGRRWSPARAAAALGVVFLVAALASAWFYLHLRESRGSMRAFNRPAAPSFSLSNKPPEFYLDLLAPAMFRDPIRPALGDRFLPIFLSEMWGDYWTSFVVYGRDTRTGRHLSGGELFNALTEAPRPDWLVTNRHEVAAYLGRVNLVSLLPAGILAAATLFGAGVLLRWLLEARAPRRGPPASGSSDTLALSALVVIATAAGYGWFLIMYPRPDTIKATYMLQSFAPLALLAGEMLLRLQRRWPAGFAVLAAAALLAVAHNLPMLVTRCVAGW